MKNVYKFTIYGRLDGLNEYTKSNRANRFGGNAIKKRNEKVISKAILEALDKHFDFTCIDYPIKLSIDWYEPNNRRDMDNVIFAQKFILDALVKENILKDDNRNIVKEIRHRVFTDKDNPRIEVKITKIT